MLMSAKLKAELSAKIDRMTSLAKGAESAVRMFTDAERSEFDRLEGEADALRKQAAEAEKREAFLRGQDAPGQRYITDDKGERHLLLKGGKNFDRLADRVERKPEQPVNLARMVRGIATGNWNGAEFERKALGENSQTAGGVTVPMPIASFWLDLMRAKSVCVAAGTPTVEMTSQTLMVTRLDADPVARYKPENTAWAESEPVFGGTLMYARTLGTIVRTSLELLEDSPLASEMILGSMTGAMALAMDAGLLTGDGVVNTVDKYNPLGLLAHPDVNEIPAVGTPGDYDPWLDAMHQIELNNMSGVTVIDHPTTLNTLRKLTTGIGFTDGTTDYIDKTKLTQPVDYAALQKLNTTALTSATLGGCSIVGDFANGALLGMRTGMTIEATRVGDDTLAKAQVLIRAYTRMEAFVARPKAFTRLIGITP